ncbi:MAG: hypothetical protein GX131_06975 [candidate division WS1 bacterium]|nr:hypothetical protein [candidate division WS1 bacterium]
MTACSRWMLLALVVSLLICTEGLMAQDVDLGDGFIDHGVATPISNHRGTVATVDGNGEPVVLAWLMDHRGGYCLLMINALTGEAEQFTTPQIGDSPFASVLSTRNRFYTHYGSTFMEFDPVAREFTFSTKTKPQMAMSMTEGDDGRIWSATYPNSGVVSYDPTTGEFRDYGHLYAQNWRQYPRDIAVDDQGWVYFGVGSTASQIIILNPETGEATPVLSEEQRIQGYSPVTRYADGKVYGRNGDQWYELYAGVATPIAAAPEATPKPIIASTQGLFHRDFGTGHRLASLNLVDRVLTVTTPEGETLTHEFEYESEGAHSMGLAAASDGTICGGTAFPMRFFSFNPRTSEWINRPAHGQWNTIAPTDTLFYVGGYGHGFMLEWDPSREWVNTVKDDPTTNPRFLAQAAPDINRPHDLLVHPGGRYVILAGTPGYGYTGGGLMFWDREAQQAEVIKHEQLVEHQSVMSMVALADGKVLCGTTIAAGTGGEVRATVAELFIIDPETKQIEWRQVFEGAKNISDMTMAPTGLVYGVVDSARFFVFDPATREIAHLRDLTEEFGLTNGQQGPRIFVHVPEDRIFMLFRKGIAELDLETHEIEMLAESPIGVGPGGDYLDGRIYFGSGSHVYSWPVPEKE